MIRKGRIGVTEKRLNKVEDHIQEGIGIDLGSRQKHQTDIVCDDIPGSRTTVRTGLRRGAARFGGTITTHAPKETGGSGLPVSPRCRDMAGVGLLQRRTPAPAWVFRVFSTFHLTKRAVGRDNG